MTNIFDVGTQVQLLRDARSVLGDISDAWDRFDRLLAQARSLDPAAFDAAMQAARDEAEGRGASAHPDPPPPR